MMLTPYSFIDPYGDSHEIKNPFMVDDSSLPRSVSGVTAAS